MQQRPKTPAEYQEEMMRLYRRAHPATPPNTNPTPAPQPRPEPMPAPQPRPEPMPAPQPRPEPMPEPQPRPEPMPAPQPRPEPMPEPQPRPEPMPEPQPRPEPMPEPQPPSMFPSEILPMPEVSLELESLLPQETPDDDKVTAFGFLKVITRSANEARPLEDVTVTITGREGAETILHYTAKTNESGETERIPLPAPSPVSPDVQNPEMLYRNYDVSIYLPGYFRMESRNLPIFPGITSLQKFAMIPLPQNPSETVRTIVYDNTEPRFPS